MRFCFISVLYHVSCIHNRGSGQKLIPIPIDSIQKWPLTRTKKWLQPHAKKHEKWLQPGSNDFNVYPFRLYNKCWGYSYKSSRQHSFFAIK